IRIDGFFERYRAVYSPQLQESNWRNFQDCWERFETSRSEAQHELRSKQLNSEGLRNSCEQLTQNHKEMVALRDAMLPLVLKEKLKVAKEQYALAMIIQKESSDLIADPRFLDRCLQSLGQDIAPAEQYFQDPNASPGELHTMLDR